MDKNWAIYTVLKCSLGVLVESKLSFKEDDIILLADAAHLNGALLWVQRVLGVVHIAHRRDLALKVEAEINEALFDYSSGSKFLP